MLNSQKVPEHSWISIHGKISCSRSFHGTRGLQRDPGPGIDFWTLFWDRDRILKTVTLIYLENTFLKKLCQEQNFGVSLNFGSRAFKVLKTGHYNLRSFFLRATKKMCGFVSAVSLRTSEKKWEKKTSLEISGIWPESRSQSRSGILFPGVKTRRDSGAGPARDLPVPCSIPGWYFSLK